MSLKQYSQCCQDKICNGGRIIGQKMVDNSKSKNKQFLKGKQISFYILLQGVF